VKAVIIGRCSCCIGSNRLGLHFESFRALMEGCSIQKVNIFALRIPFNILIKFNK
jgi:hypothetical protein